MTGPCALCSMKGDGVVSRLLCKLFGHKWDLQLVMSHVTRHDRKIYRYRCSRCKVATVKEVSLH